MERFVDKKDVKFIESILDGMQDWVRVIDRDDNIIYANRAMKEEFGEKTIGKKCFELLGQSKPCSNCISKRAAKIHHTFQREEKINGRIYSVRSSPIVNKDGKVEACVEVLRDITQEKLMEEKLRQQYNEMKHDLQIARMMQYNLLPGAGKLSNNRVEFTYTYIPCEAIGGDFFDIYEIDDSHVGVYVADVSGHGVPASMLTIFFRQAMNKSLLSPSKALKELFLKFNHVKFNEEFYITMFYAIIDTEHMEITYANAGHHALPMLITDGQLEILNAVGIPISNWTDNVEYEESKQKLNPGDRMIFYTDGVIEAANEKGERYGDVRFKEFILNHWAKHIEIFNTKMVEDIYHFKSQGKAQISELLDDLTILIIDMKN